MGPNAAALVAQVIDRLEGRSRSTGRPPLPTLHIVEALRFFVREGVQWRELRATAGRASGGLSEFLCTGHGLNVVGSGDMEALVE
jgi:hypothetical protein